MSDFPDESMDIDEVGEPETQSLPLSRSTVDIQVDDPGDCQVAIPANISQVDDPGNRKVDDPGNRKVDDPGDCQVDDPGDCQVDDPGNRKVDDPGDCQVDDPGDCQVDDPAKSQVVNPAERQVDDPANRKVDDPANRKADDPGDCQVDDPAKSQVVNPAKRQVDDPAKSQVVNPAKRQVDDPANRKADDPGDCQVDDPAKSQVVNPSKRQVDDPGNRKVDDPANCQEDDGAKSQVVNPAKSQVDDAANSQVGNRTGNHEVSKTITADSSDAPPTDVPPLASWCYEGVDITIAPPVNKSTLKGYYGRHGIELTRNSCYLDSSLFSFFFSTNAFDACLLQSTKTDDKFAKDVKGFLHRIASDLRRNKFVAGKTVMELRRKLVDDGKFTQKLLGTFMDPEEFLSVLLHKALKLPPFFTCSTGLGDFMHQIRVSKQLSMSKSWATVQELFEGSMEFYGNLTLKALPRPALIIFLPRSRQLLVDYKIIVPSLELDLSPFLPDSSDKNPKMKLVAMVCIANFHYTAFVRCGEEWVYFDSVGPSITRVNDCSQTIAKMHKDCNAGQLRDNSPVHRIFKDCHYCIYEPQDQL